MFAFPTAPIEPRVFFEETIPKLFGDLKLDERERSVNLKVGVVLTSAADGPQSAEWTLHFADGDLHVLAGRETDCDLTIVQRVTDWRSALWEGRPGLIADGVAALIQSGPAAFRPAGVEVGGGHPEALKGLGDLRGLIEAVIADRAEDEAEDRDDWRIGIQLGPGPISETPDATIELGAEQAEAMRRGELHPVEALITGQLRLEGDLGLIIQLQAIAMMASPTPS